MNILQTNITTARGTRTTRLILKLYPKKEDEYLQRLRAAAQTLRQRYPRREFEYITGNAAGSTLWRDVANKMKLYFVEDGKVRKA